MKTIAGSIASLLLAFAFAGGAQAQNILVNCPDPIQQDASKVFRSGIWKQWIYWVTPGPSAYAAVLRVVAEVNGARSAAGLPTLLPNPSNPVIVSVFSESNPRGKDGSSPFPFAGNDEAFFATFVDDTAGGSEVLFLTDSVRSNDILTTAKSVPGVPGVFEYSIESEVKANDSKVSTEWEITFNSRDKIRFAASYPSSAIYFRNVFPSRVAFARCNQQSFSTLIFRSAPTVSYTLFDRSKASYVDLTDSRVKVKLNVSHHDPDINAMFNDPHNVPEVLIETDRVVRIESR